MTTKNVVHAALWLVLVLAGVAAQYILAAAEFVAVSQVLVYIGAVMVLFLFGIMLTRAQIGRERGPQQQATGRSASRSPCVLLGAAVVRAASTPSRRRHAARASGPTPTAGDRRQHPVARTSCRSSALSFVLLAAAIGAIVLARKD